MPPANIAAIARCRGACCLSCPVGRAIYLRPKSRRCAAFGLRNAPAGADPAVKQLARLRLVWRFPWSVGAACMRPATFVLPYRFLVATAFGLCVGAAYMPPAKRRGNRPFMGYVAFALRCRAGVHARRTDNFLKFYNVRRGQDPALQTGANGQRTGNPVWGKPLPGGMYASPTNTRYRVREPKTLQQGERARAAYIRPLQTMANALAMQYHMAVGQTGAAGPRPPPYRAGQTGNFPATNRPAHPPVRSMTRVVR